MYSYMAYYMTGFIMIPVFIFSLICQMKVKSTYRKYSAVRNINGLTGAMAATRLLQSQGITDVKIRRISGELTDNYNPKTKVISLSEGVYDSPSIAAVGVACHEAGHACQYAQNYFPIKLRNLVIPMTRFGSYLGIPLVLLGLVFTFEPLIYVGIVLYAIVVVFQLVTLPVEFNASSRALTIIKQSGFLQEHEYKGARKVLTSAAMTYVAALVSALTTLFRLLLMVNRRR